MTKWYLSKTLYMNVIALLAVVLAFPQIGIIITPDETAAMMLVINFIMRAVTNEPLEM